MVQESSGFDPNRLLDSGGYNWPRVKPYFGAGQATDQLPKTKVGSYRGEGCITLGVQCRE